MPVRPIRVKIKNELQNQSSLNTGENAFAQLQCGHTLLVLGIGPEPDRLNRFIVDHGLEPNGYYLECPEFFSQMPASWADEIPKTLKALQSESETPPALPRLKTRKDQKHPHG